MSSGGGAYRCPAGFDCSFGNSCPALSAECPRGWFCGSYAGSPLRDAIDAELERADDRFVPRTDRWPEAECPAGFACANATSIARCPEGTWCPEGVPAPLDCDALSYCAAQSRYQLNFAAPLLALLYTLLLVGAGALLGARQRAAAARCRQLQAKGGAAATAGAGRSVGAAEDDEDDSDDTGASGGGSGPPSPASTNGSGFSFDVAGMTVRGAPDSSASPHLADSGPAGRGADAASASSGRALLFDATLHVPAGRVTVILGPSGCGKSLLLAALRDVLPAGCRAAGGTLLVRTSGGAPVPLGAPLRAAAALVPQQDLLDRALTPRELLRFSALTRLPQDSAVSSAAEATEAAVGAALRALGLEGCADVVVGGAGDGTGGGAANISGGQVKRASIGVELVAAPDTLLLDEPTSGLDATGALALLRRLRAVSAARGVTIVATLAQPRAEAFACADHVILLQAGGRVAYCGARAGAIEFLARAVPAAVGGAGGSGSSSATLPRGVNPADWIIDVLDGRAPGSANADLPALWAAERAERAARAGSEGCAASGAGTASSAKIAADAASPNAAAAPLTALRVPLAPLRPPAPPPFVPRRLPGVVAQLLLHAQRALLTRVRDLGALRLYGLLHVFMACGLSSGFSIYTRGSYEGTFVGPLAPAFLPFVPSALRDFAGAGNVDDLGLQQLCFFVTISLGTASGMCAVSTFGGQLELFRREAGAGASLVALGVGRMLAELVIVCWVASLFTAAWMLFSHAGHWWNWLAVAVGTSFAASGIGHLASACIDSPTLAAALVMVVMIVTSVLSGVNPRLAQVLPFPVLNLPWLLSFATYTAQGAYACWSEYQRPLRDVDHGAARFGYHVESVGPAVGALFALGVLWRAVALAVLASRVDPTGFADALRAVLRCGRGKGGHTPEAPQSPPPPFYDEVRVIESPIAAAAAGGELSPRAERVRAAGRPYSPGAAAGSAVAAARSASGRESF